jgi:hypothetical protein
MDTVLRLHYVNPSCHYSDRPIVFLHNDLNQHEFALKRWSALGTMPEAATNITRSRANRP